MVLRSSSLGFEMKQINKKEKQINKKVMMNLMSKSYRDIQRIRKEKPKPKNKKE